MAQEVQPFFKQEAAGSLQSRLAPFFPMAAQARTHKVLFAHLLIQSWICCFFRMWFSTHGCESTTKVFLECSWKPKTLRADLFFSNHRTAAHASTCQRTQITTVTTSNTKYAHQGKTQQHPPRPPPLPIPPPHTHTHPQHQYSHTNTHPLK